LIIKTEDFEKEISTGTDVYFASKKTLRRFVNTLSDQLVIMVPSLFNNNQLHQTQQKRQINPRDQDE
jgi:hypothetical protein